VGLGIVLGVWRRTSGRKRAVAPASWALRARDWACSRFLAIEAVERICPTAWDKV
jgi:hypothetical protein